MIHWPSKSKPQGRVQLSSLLQSFNFLSSRSCTKNGYEAPELRLQGVAIVYFVENLAPKSVGIKGNPRSCELNCSTFYLQTRISVPLREYGLFTIVQNGNLQKHYGSILRVFMWEIKAAQHSCKYTLALSQSTCVCAHVCVCVCVFGSETVFVAQVKS